ncbi:hypothetical protein cyc_03570 [Cyclospora cayetanensis]|uniref:Uncharacterized protein n=1 Tax=Cyclospora cayetanensis TaxID=88456 RepID=A0A1D3CZH0_9EIME|nr:hypothetical protein cyc_03570 [Cyclospora cayetanensis]
MVIGVGGVGGATPAPVVPPAALPYGGSRAPLGFGVGALGGGGALYYSRSSVSASRDRSGYRRGGVRRDRFGSRLKGIGGCHPWRAP